MSGWDGNAAASGAGAVTETASTFLETLPLCVLTETMKGPK